MKCSPHHHHRRGWHHGHGPPWARHRRMRSARPLARRIFHWFGASILFTVVMATLAVWGLGRVFGSEWSRDIDRLSTHLSRNFSDAWADPAARDAYARQLADDFDLSIQVLDGDRRLLSEVGPSECFIPHRMDVPLAKDGVVFGHLALCRQNLHPPGGLFKVFFVLVLVGFVLWMASLMIARRITRSLSHVASVAEGIGQGDLSRRTHLSRHRTEEVAVLADAIDDMAERLEKQLEDQRELLAAVSHELRTPLGHLRVLIELVRQRQAAPEKLAKSLDGMESEIAEIDRLVGELLASSKLDFGVVNPQRLVAKDVAAAALERRALASTLLEVQGDPHLVADATLLARALANLLDNAERHGGGVTAVRVAEADDGVAFSVEDAGPGVPGEDRDRIFAPLQKGASERGSLGLGLALVDRIVTAHGGWVGVDDRPEGGARFTIVLPVTPKGHASDR
ncbi:MAG: HAMP domain-containing sensor histidine kinase [Deltaproteobacteria bacterium]|jgi:two-component system OmpR family sensor kinase